MAQSTFEAGQETNIEGLFLIAADKGAHQAQAAAKRLDAFISGAKFNIYIAINYSASRVPPRCPGDGSALKLKICQGDTLGGRASKSLNFIRGGSHADVRRCGKGD